jgi:hypothetical protein
MPPTQKTEAEIRLHSDSDKGGRRLGDDRRSYSYHGYLPERRSGKDRRCGGDRRKKPRPA